MASDTLITLTGFVGTQPRHHVTEGGLGITTFRLATTPRKFDQTQNSWSDGKTEWWSIRTFGQCAYNVAQSVHKGQPLVVYGKFSTSEWTGEDGVHRSGLEVKATAIGHDLSFGSGNFERTTTQRSDADVQPSSQDEDAPQVHELT